MIDKVRASRDGHEFHEAWTARLALQLLLPTNHLAGIAVEGLSPSDSKKASQAAIEVADLSLYYGRHHSFEQCDRLEVLQFKYSIGSQDKDFRAADAKKTIKKFAATERDYIKKHGVEDAQQKITYKLITNRPVLSELQNAIKSLAKDTEPTGPVEKEQAKQIKAAAGFKSDGELAKFLSRVEIVGTAGSLTEHQNKITGTIIDWSSTNDALAKARVGNLIIFIDAADNAGMEASDRHQPSFPTLLLETFFAEEMPYGLKIVASCRTERRQLAQGSASCTEFELHPFNTDEIRLFLETRIENCTQGQINVAQARSGGNPRVLAHLVSSDRGLLDPSEINKPIELDELISKNINDACALAVKQGYSQQDLKAFLAGLAVLPPPIPIDEYAEAHGMTVSAVESFAADKRFVV